MTYAFLPHDEGFGAQSVIRPAYLLNYPVRQGAALPESLPALLRIDADNVICEAVKPCEDAQNAYILRLYEAEGTYTSAAINFQHPVRKICETNMLEENIACLGEEPVIRTAFKPFEIKTYRVYY